MMSVKGSVDEATAAIGLLRATLQEMAPLWHSLDRFEKALTDIDWPEEVDTAAAEPEELRTKTTGPRIEAVAAPEETPAPEPEEPDVEPTTVAPHASNDRAPPPDRLDVPASGDSAPYSYTVTVEEMGTRVKLVPLHRSLNRVEGIRQLTLASYTNGVAIVSIDSEIELEGTALEEALTAGMSKTCRIMSGEGPSFLARIGDTPAPQGKQRHSSR
jgi:hypothetical protein